MALIREETRPRVPRRKPPKVPISRRKQGRRPTRRITYNVQAIQSLRATEPTTPSIGFSFADIPLPSLADIRTRMEANRQANVGAVPGIISRLEEQGFGSRYVERMVGFNALPQTITSLTSRALQAAITHGPPVLQRAILRGLGPWPGPGLARLVDTAIRGGTPGGVPGLNFGSGYLFADAPRGAANIPETRPSMFGGGPPAQRQQFGFSPPGWGIGR